MSSSRRRSQTRATVGWACLGALLLWPLVLQGAPLVFWDSNQYQAAGDGIWDHILGTSVSESPEVTEGSGKSDPVEGGASTLRSPFYSVVVAASSRFGGSHVWVLLGHALCVCLVLACLWSEARPGASSRGGRDALPLVGVALLSSLPVFTCYLMPDVFAGLLILCFVGFVALSAQGPGWPRWGLAAVAFAAVLVHPSHLPLGVGLASVVSLPRVRSPAAPVSRLWMSWAPVLSGAMLMLATSWFAFGEATVAPKRLPVVLARALEDGPTRRHVEAACAADPDRYVLCRYIEDLPRRSGEILFHEGGFSRIGERDLAAIRAEETQIVAAGVSTGPLEQLRRSLLNVGAQLVKIGYEDIQLGDLRLDAFGRWLPKDEHDRGAFPRALLEPLQWAVVLLSIAYIAARGGRGRSGGAERRALLVMVAGLLGNALICGGLSSPADRYQSRVIWVVPVLAAWIWTRHRKELHDLSA